MPNAWIDLVAPAQAALLATAPRNRVRYRRPPLRPELLHGSKKHGIFSRRPWATCTTRGLACAQGQLCRSICVLFRDRCNRCFRNLCRMVPHSLAARWRDNLWQAGPGEYDCVLSLFVYSISSCTSFPSTLFDAESAAAACNQGGHRRVSHRSTCT